MRYCNDGDDDGDDNGDGDGDDDWDDDGNKDGIDNYNAVSRSGSGGLIFDIITMPWYRGGGSVGNGSVAIEHYISTFLKMCHKVLYENFGVLDWRFCHMKKKVPLII